jgi:hypothetical protein
MDYDQLATLMGAYYHEDFEGIWPTLDLYLHDAGADELRLLSRELDDFLARTPTADIPEATWRLGSCLWLGDAAEPYAEWLVEIRRRVVDASHQSQTG